jgi:protein TonB
MFEDSTFESQGRIRTRSRGWMLATFCLNSSILLALVLFPLLHPEALPRLKEIYLTIAPPPMQTETPAPPQRVQIETARAYGNPLEAPHQIPTGIFVPQAPEPRLDGDVVSQLASAQGQGNTTEIFHGTGNRATVRAVAPSTVRVSSVLAEGMLLRKTLPVYPPIARATRTEGAVVLSATISKTGTIENLRVVSGSALLQTAAVDAVKSWLYRPYLLNGEPVEVETTVNVVFTLQR